MGSTPKRALMKHFNILDNKALVITESLIKSGHISALQKSAVYEVVLSQLINGGDYQLLEDESGTLHPKAILRNDDGNVIAMQG